MTADEFKTLAENLTGTPVKETTTTDEEILTGLLSDQSKPVGHSQLNELLLLVNKDRMERPFYDYFFGADCTIASLRLGVDKFQRLAMLAFGNFIYAYRTLSPITNLERLKHELGEWARTPDEATKNFAERSPKLIDIAPVVRENTPLVGYLSAIQIVAELERAILLQNTLPVPAGLAGVTWQFYTEQVLTAAKPNEHGPLRSVLNNFQAKNAAATLADFAQHLVGVIENLSKRDQTRREVQQQATRNQDIYLTWDHMDIYFATSMRKRWEYEDLYDFVNGLMNQAELADLNLRYFDPTQAFTKNRVNKGLVEALMLKRARCTVYSVQDTDTLGKDSELAATLAQGKPVIAYVPKIEIEKRTNELVKEGPATIQDRLRFVIYADDQFAQTLSPDEEKFLSTLTPVLNLYEQGRIWRALPDTDADQAVLAGHDADIARLCGMIARSEARIYDKRANTLKSSHPLGIQVNLSTGVANGVLVVRTIPECAKLLRGVLTNSLEFEIRDSPGEQMWYLLEKISGSVYRVVSRDRKLTNCFWNFYRHPRG